MLTWFAMRSDPMAFSEVSAPLTAEAQSACSKNSATDRAHTSAPPSRADVLAQRGCCGALGADVLAQRGRCGAPGGSVRSSSQTQSSRK